MSHSQARRSAPASGAVAVAGAPARAGTDRGGSPYGYPPGYTPTARTVSSGGRTSTVYGRRPGDVDLDVDARGSQGGRSSGARAGGRPAPGGRPPGGRGTGGGRRGGGPPRPTPGAPRKRRRDPLWARMLVIFGALLMMASGGVIVGGKAIVAKATGGFKKAQLLGGAGIQKTSGGKALAGPLNILLVGIDERPDGKDLVRADSILVLHIPASHAEAYLFSIPRDTLVDIPAFKKTGYRGGREKVNGAFAHGWGNGGGREGGFELLAITVQRLMGLKKGFNAGAIVDFQGFGKIVKALGGVDLCVDTARPVVSEHFGFDNKGRYRHPRDGGKAMVYKPGECRKFADWEALDYVRQRKSLDDGDYGRQRHQQQFVKALAKEAKKQGLGGNPLKLVEIINAAGKTLTVDIGNESFENWLFTVRGVADTDVVMIKVNGGKFNSIQCGGESCEGLTQETRDMFVALNNDELGKFVIDHPEFVSA